MSSDPSLAPPHSLPLSPHPAPLCTSSYPHSTLFSQSKLCPNPAALPAQPGAPCRDAMWQPPTNKQCLRTPVIVATTPNSAEGTDKWAASPPQCSRFPPSLQLAYYPGGMGSMPIADGMLYQWPTQPMGGAAPSRPAVAGMCAGRPIGEGAHLYGTSSAWRLLKRRFHLQARASAGGGMGQQHKRSGAGKDLRNVGMRRVRKGWQREREREMGREEKDSEGNVGKKRSVCSLVWPRSG